MSARDEVRARIQQMRDKAEELKATAERTNDPDERKRLQERARKLKSDAEQESMMRGGDIYPSE
ncbi:DUF6381 family protein [Streptomyces sp. NPDC002851]